jgi:selenocysteine-specific elongation factor
VGTVATGTLWSGTIAPGDSLHVEPGGRAVRVRSVQVHDLPLERAEAGQRVAVNLPAVERRELARGDVLVAPGHFPVSYRLDVQLTELAPLPAALTVHVGTQAVPARLVRDGDFAQLRLESPVVAARGDRVVLRTETTVGGGVVLDPAPRRGLDRSRLELLATGEPVAILQTLVHEPVTAAELQAHGLLSPVELERALASLPSAGGHHFSERWLDELGRTVRARLAARAEAHPLDPGLPLAELLPDEPWTAEVADRLGIERRGAKAYLPGAAATLGTKADAAAALEARLAEEEFVRVEDRQLAAYLEDAGSLRRVGDGFAVSPALYERGRTTLASLDPITLGAFRDALGVGRRTAQLLLERYDADGLTLRRGDVRVLRRARR